ncbi:GNAT family N-acetyltransferase [Motiliproteus sp. MSK22-1]|uniref:GNAT family N-acetyltransferase n=1 Tax=Motiliproteus sp. MSK22-1 TaxID=1897630 RepID=UPI0009771EB4|nr:GNAT family N-acetyltransferase [Motiliproteus sp. MSK22-1]OMH29075.1 hypothetical protein BGP75_20180 [Motiliproteus sp. MSK22-1]
MKAQPILKTERLLLRPFVADDATRVELLAGDKKIADVTANIPHPYPTGLANRWISEQNSKWQRGELASFAITLLDTRELIGSISIMSISDQSGELGYWVGTEYWGRGFCTEASKKVVEFGFGTLKLNHIHAHHLRRNPASGKVLLNSGFQHLGSGESECGYRKNKEMTERYSIVLE